jgi:hypothetical protein
MRWKGKIHFGGGGVISIQWYSDSRWHPSKKCEGRPSAPARSERAWKYDKCGDSTVKGWALLAIPSGRRASESWIRECGENWPIISHRPRRRNVYASLSRARNEQKASSSCEEYYGIIIIPRQQTSFRLCESLRTLHCSRPTAVASDPEGNITTLFQSIAYRKPCGLWRGPGIGSDTRGVALVPRPLLRQELRTHSHIASVFCFFFCGHH